MKIYFSYIALGALTQTGLTFGTKVINQNINQLVGPGLDCGVVNDVSYSCIPQQNLKCMRVPNHQQSKCVYVAPVADPCDNNHIVCDKGLSCAKVPGSRLGQCVDPQRSALTRRADVATSNEAIYYKRYKNELYGSDGSYFVLKNGKFYFSDCKYLYQDSLAPPYTADKDPNDRSIIYVSCNGGLKKYRQDQPLPKKDYETSLIATAAAKARSAKTWVRSLVCNWFSC
ncbi:hypothetical protein BDF19DRAFT_444028 [Syncephalis fuscata]|nr:hypothetical protein BDF19DRAFT_444028 [Syncephalis fuscata]